MKRFVAFILVALLGWNVLLTIQGVSAETGNGAANRCNDCYKQHQTGQCECHNAM